MPTDDFALEAVSALRSLVNQQITKRTETISALAGRVSDLSRRLEDSKNDQRAINTRITERLVTLESQFGNEPLKGPGTAFNAGYREALRDMLQRDEDDEGRSIFVLANGLATQRGIALDDTPEEAAAYRGTS
jgi:hypothetical protein